MIRKIWHIMFGHPTVKNTGYYYSCLEMTNTLKPMPRIYAEGQDMWQCICGIWFQPFEKDNHAKG